MIEYDETVIVTFATRLYARARTLAVAYFVFAAVMGALVGGLGSAFVPGDVNGGAIVMAALLCGALGYVVGWEKAFALRLRHRPRSVRSRSSAILDGNQWCCGLIRHRTRRCEADRNRALGAERASGKPGVPSNIIDTRQCFDDPALVATLGKIQRPVRVLVVVDGDTSFSASLQRMLREYEVVIELSSDAAIARIRDGERFDEIVASIDPLAHVGIRLHEALLVAGYEREARSMVFVAGSTAHDSIESRVFAAQMRDRCVRRPFEISTLKAMLLRLRG